MVLKVSRHARRLRNNFKLSARTDRGYGRVEPPLGDEVLKAVGRENWIIRPVDRSARLEARALAAYEVLFMLCNHCSVFDILLFISYSHLLGHWDPPQRMTLLSNWGGDVRR